MGSIHLQSTYHKKRKTLLETLNSEVQITNEYYQYDDKNISYVIESNLGIFTGTAKFTEGDDYNENIGKGLAKTRAYRLYNMEVGVHIENNYLIVLKKRMDYYKNISKWFKEKEQAIQASIDKYYANK